MDFPQQLEACVKQANQALSRFIAPLPFQNTPVVETMQYGALLGGKRLRPFLVYATGHMFGVSTNTLDAPAAAVECIHAYSLIHDDLPGIDNDDFRHGKPTNHKKFNEATAILAGDGLLNNAYMVISNDLRNTKLNIETYNIENDKKEYNLNNLINSTRNKDNLENLNKKIMIFNEFSNAVDRMIAGEYIDTEYEGKQVLEENLEYMDENKTGALLKLSVRMGALLAKCTEEDVERLTSYAKKIGLAFQIKDDILSEEGDEKILGKPVGNDKKLNKCTYVSKYGLEGAKDKLNKLIEEAINDIKVYGEKAEFLMELAIYIKDREK